MRNLTTMAVFFCLAIFTSTAQTIKTENSSISFEVSNMALNTVEGTFKGMEGTVVLDKITLVHQKLKLV
ncbi:MAG: hypothetical protein C7M88_09605 [Candidatus Arcticimaribacter sp.]|nr:MAG: hypothetical protein C7M88_09605 [Candidatus Arcticimaribacter sp.]